MLVWILAGLAIALVPLIVIAVTSDRKYRRLFRDAHLAEVAATLAQLWSEAEATDLEHSAVTSLELALTWRPKGPEIALSHGSGKLAKPAAAFLISWIEAWLALPDDTRRRYLLAAGRYTLRLAALPDAVTLNREPPEAEALDGLRQTAADRMRKIRFS